MTTAARAFARGILLATSLFGAAFQTAPAARPIKIVLLFDTSSSMTWLFQDPMSLVVGRLAGQHLSPGGEALRAAASSLGPEAQVRVGTFGERLRISPAWLPAHDIPKALAGVVHEGGHSPIWDAVYLAVEQLEATPDRRVILLVSDGRSSGNVHGFEEALDRARRSEVTVHVAYPTFNEKKQTLEADRPGDPAARLKRLADGTGGRYAEPSQRRPQEHQLATFVGDVLKGLHDRR